MAVHGSACIVEGMGAAPPSLWPPYPYESVVAQTLYIEQIRWWAECVKMTSGAIAGSVLLWGW